MKKMLVYPTDPNYGYKVVYRKKEEVFRTYKEAKAFQKVHPGSVLISKWTGEPPTAVD